MADNGVRYFIGHLSHRLPRNRKPIRLLCTERRRQQQDVCNLINKTIQHRIGDMYNTPRQTLSVGMFRFFMKPFKLC